MSAPRILLVDDQRQVSRMLRSSLELSGREYVVVDVPSGEEALLELGRGPVDLIVTDLRLPGMSGLELVERVRQLNPHARAILITGQPTDEVRARAQALGVVAFLPKPIGTTFFLEAVDHALKERADAGESAEVDTASLAHLQKQLEVGRRDLGALALLVVDGRGRVLASAGDLESLDLAEALPSIATAHSAGQKVSSQLGAEEPRNFHFFDGPQLDLFLTSVGSERALLVALKGGEGTGKMGAVLHFGRRAAQAVERALAEEEGEQPAEPAGVEESIMPLPDTVEEISLPSLEGVDRKEAEAFWARAVSEGEKGSGDGDALSYDEARDMGLVPDDEE